MGFRALFTKSAVKRIGRARFVRNVLIAIGNSGDAALADEAERLLDDTRRWFAARQYGRSAVSTARGLNATAKTGAQSPIRLVAAEWDAA